MDSFDSCVDISNLLTQGKKNEARECLIKLLDRIGEGNYESYVNSLIREVGLFPYMQYERAHWTDRFAYNSFRVDIGRGIKKTLHIEQSKILKKLLKGESLAVSAPTSFGKSYIVDSYISIKKPSNVMIIVPTLALTDEIRRRIYSRFSDDYKIITSAGATPSKKNIYIFPQERAIHYAAEIDELDLLVVDEFYKASSGFDKDRSISLQRAILAYRFKSKQQYYLAPNIDIVIDNQLIGDVEFYKTDFCTVFLNKWPLYKTYEKTDENKSKKLLEIIDFTSDKTLIYSGTHKETKKVSEVIKNITNQSQEIKTLLNDFSDWLRVNYTPNWELPNLIEKGVGIHNGLLHRTLSQIQVNLFEQKVGGIDILISTSSIIEGVNTSAKNIIIWKNKNGPSNLDDFTFKNIMGRGGRMFKHFVGNVFILEQPPQGIENQLELEIPDGLLVNVNPHSGVQLTEEQLAYLKSYKEEIDHYIDSDKFQRLIDSNKFSTSNSEVLKRIAKSIKEKPSDWACLKYLNSQSEVKWRSALFKVLQARFNNDAFPLGLKHTKIVDFICSLSNNWGLDFSEILNMSDPESINIDKFFQLERFVTYSLSSLLSDINLLYNAVSDDQMDISPFIYKASHAFLPKVVFLLEEYGLPRMICKKIEKYELYDFQTEDDIYDAIRWFKELGKDKLLSRIDFSSFDTYILEHFYQGISLETIQGELFN